MSAVMLFTSRKAALRRATLVGGLVALAALVSAANAFAVSGTPINIGTPYESGPPSVAVDSAGTAYIAWANEKDLAPVTTNIVQYCVLPAGAAACSHTGNLVPADSGAYVDGVHVLVDGSTVVILADVYGTAGSSAGDYEPEQEWQSTDGGAIFTVVNEGLSVTDGILSADTGPLSAVIVPGTSELGFGWQSAGGPPTFNAFPLTSPPECSTQKCDGTPIPDGGPYPFAELEPETNPDTIGNSGGQFASQIGTNPGVLSIFDTLNSNGPFACAPGNGTAYMYGSGAQGSTNNYNISPGTANSAWKVAATQADCNVDNFAVSGGPSGFGVLENDTAHHNIVYHRFDQMTQSFDTPYVTIAANEGEGDPAVSQDGAGGVYATFLLGGGGGPISLAYSSNGGTTWTGPATLNPNTDGGANEVTSFVGPTGQGWAAWRDNGSVYAQQFVATDAIPPAIPISKPPPTPPPPPAPSSEFKVEAIVTSSGGTVTITIVVTQSGKATLEVTISTTTLAHTAAVDAKAKKCKHGQIKLKGKCVPASTVVGKTSANATAGVPLKLTVNLSSKIKSLLKKGKTVHLTGKLTFQSALGGKPTTHTYGLTVKGHKPKHK
jgi:hypothetical protein